MEIQKKTLELLKKALWSTTVTDAQYFAACSISSSLSSGVKDVEIAWSRYETALASKKQSPINKRKFKDLYKELVKSDVRHVVHYLSATATSVPQSV